MKEDASIHFTDTGHLSELAFAKISECIAQDRSLDLPRPVRDHLQACSKCRHEVAELYQVMRTTGAELSTIKPQKAFRAWWWIPFVLLLGGLAYVYWPSPNVPVPTPEQPPVPSEYISPIDSDTLRPELPPPADSPAPPESSPAVPTPKDAPVYAEAYTPNDNLESLVGNQVRSGQSTTFLPAVGDTLTQGDNLEFSWSKELEGPFQIILLNSEGEVLERWSAEQPQHLVRADWSPGLYYWKLETEEDLLFVGKFAIQLP